jgi:folate-binding protein YgfZ
MPEVDCELYKLITIGGIDTVEFLQGQLTQDVGLLAAAGRLSAAWCNPKGRVVVTMRLVRIDDRIGLIVPANMADRVVQRLTMYRMRSKVEISEPSNEWKNYVDADEADPAALIRAGVPTIDESNTEQFTPHMLNLDKLGAISFTKGCYTGQEVVARTENLGKSKRRLMRYEADVDGIQVGDKLSDGERNVGEVVNVAGRDLLAVTPVELHGQTLKDDDISVGPQGLRYEL